MLTVEGGNVGNSPLITFLPAYSATLAMENFGAELLHCAGKAMSPLREVVVYSRKGCHLCEIVKETLNKLERRGGFRWREIDVDSTDELRRQFTDEVPVVFIDGRKAFKYRVDEREFLRKLAN